MKINKNYLQLQNSYLFSTISKKINEFTTANPDKPVIRMGIGDVTLPLAQVVVKAMQDASGEMGVAETFHGYGEEQGYGFLRTAVSEYYGKKNITVSDSEIFISDGAKSDIGNILDIMSEDNVVLIPNPVYPVYADTNVMNGRKIVYLNGNKENDFLPMPDQSVDCDIIYLCSPNNPTGSVYNKEQLKAWVDYANKKDAVILFDSAYEVFIQDKDLPSSIFEIEGARTCAIEVNSLSKTAGFTGTRCGYTIVPHELEREGTKLNQLWLRRQTTKFNGVSYIIQRGAEAVFTSEGQKQIQVAIDYYKENARLMSETFDELGIWYCGGKNSPYIWFQCPNNMSSWEYFDYLLENANVVGTPGEGFGTNGEGFFRLTAFGKRENVIEAMKRMKALHGK